jgi:hypothetical protein
MAYYDALTGRADRLLGTNPQMAQELSWDFDPAQMLGTRGSVLLAS